MNKQITLILFFSLISLNIVAQINTNNLLGAWELVKEVSDLNLEEGRKLNENQSNTNNQKNIKKEFFLSFYNNNKAQINIYNDAYKADYEVKDFKLTIGDNIYKIHKLTLNELIIIELNDLLPTTFYYKKSNKEIKLINEYEIVEEYHSNGQLKIKGKLHNGLDDGLWEEWHENGQKKSERLYKDGLPTGLWREWDKDGKLVKEKKWN